MSQSFKILFKILRTLNTRSKFWQITQFRRFFVYVLFLHEKTRNCWAATFDIWDMIADYQIIQIFILTAPKNWFTLLLWCFLFIIQAFLDFCSFNFCNFWFTPVYNSILFSSPLVLLSNLNLRGFCFSMFFFVQRKSRNACIFTGWCPKTWIWLSQLSDAWINLTLKIQKATIESIWCHCVMWNKISKILPLKDTAIRLHLSLCKNGERKSDNILPGTCLLFFTRGDYIVKGYS